MISSRRIRWASCAIACILALPLPLGIWAGFHLRLSPLLFVQSMLVATPLVAIAVAGGLCLAIILFKDRWFCRYLCPTGALADGLSELGRSRNVWRRIPSIHRWLALFGLGAAAFGFPIIGMLDPIALFQSAWSPLHLGMTLAAWLSAVGLFLILGLSWLVPFAWCRRICPLGGLQTVATDIRRALRTWYQQRWKSAAVGTPGSDPLLTVSSSSDLSSTVSSSSVSPSSTTSPNQPEGWRRRHLLILGTGLGAGWLLGRTGAVAKPAPVRPPGSRPESAFLASCVRCGNCTRACPTDIISPALDLTQPFALLAPKLSFEHGHCPPTCNACSQVCPTGAIQPFDVKDKATTIVGTAVINLEPCVMANGGECDRCVALCPYEAITITETDTQTLPTVVVDLCTGCGICAEKCPPKVIDIVAVIRPMAG